MELFEELSFTPDNQLKLSEYSKSEFLECNFSGLNLSELEVRQSRFIDCVFENCNLSNMVLTGPSFRSVQFKSCKLVGVNFSSISSQMDLEFIECHMDFTVFQDLKLEGTNFSNSSLKSADFSNATLKRAIFCGARLGEANFGGSNLEKADFRGAENYFIDIKHSFIKGAKFSTPEALRLLQSLEIELD
jgi:uncharacterized protein YjbI with pentapeptide repeats